MMISLDRLTGGWGLNRLGGTNITEKSPGSVVCRQTQRQARRAAAFSRDQLRLERRLAQEHDLPPIGREVPLHPRR